MHTGVLNQRARLATSLQSIGRLRFNCIRFALDTIFILNQLGGIAPWSKMSSYAYDKSLSHAQAMLMPLAAATLFDVLGCYWAYYAVLQTWRRWPAMPFWLRLLAAVPTLITFLASPLWFSKATQPLWIYLHAGVVVWWSAHKLLALLLGRGPLLHAKSLSAFTCMTLFPAAFVKLNKEELEGREPAQGQGKRTADWAHRAAARGLLREPAWRLALYTTAKFVAAAAMVWVIIQLRNSRIDPGFFSRLKMHSVQPWAQFAPAPARFGSWTTLAEHFFFLWIVYCSFSLVMDGPAAAMQVCAQLALVNRFIGFSRSYHCVLTVDTPPPPQLQAAGFTSWSGMSLIPHFDQPWLSITFRELWGQR